MKNATVRKMSFFWFALLFYSFSQKGMTQNDGLKERETLRTLSLQEEASSLPSSAIAAPALKWAYGGCFSSWCQTGWYSSPAVADINGDGKQEVLWGSYDLVAVSGAEGKLLWRASSDNRIWPGAALADLTGDGDSGNHGGTKRRPIGCLQWQWRGGVDYHTFC